MIATTEQKIRKIILSQPGEVNKGEKINIVNLWKAIDELEENKEEKHFMFLVGH